MITSKSDLSSTRKCDQIRINNCHEFDGTEICAYPKLLFIKLASDVAIFPHNFKFPAKLRVILIGLIYASPNQGL